MIGAHSQQQARPGSPQLHYPEAPARVIFADGGRAVEQDEVVGGRTQKKQETIAEMKGALKQVLEDLKDDAPPAKAAAQPKPASAPVAVAPAETSSAVPASAEKKPAPSGDEQTSKKSAEVLPDHAPPDLPSGKAKGEHGGEDPKGDHGAAGDAELASVQEIVDEEGRTWREVAPGEWVDQESGEQWFGDMAGGEWEGGEWDGEEQQEEETAEVPPGEEGQHKRTVGLWSSTEEEQDEGEVVVVAPPPPPPYMMPGPGSIAGIGGGVPVDDPRRGD